MKTTRLCKKQLILTNTIIKSKPLVPEIKLHLIDKTCAWYHQSSVPELSCDPFWAVFWPGGQVLSRFILDNPTVVKKKSVVDVGCGCGALGIASSMAGAGKIVSNDIDSTAIEATSINSHLNNVFDPILSTDNLLTSVSPSNEERQVIFLGDMFYEESFAKTVLKWCVENHKLGSEVYIGDPGRWGLEFIRDHINCIAEYEINDEDCDEYRTAKVYRFIPDFGKM